MSSRFWLTALVFVLSVASSAAQAQSQPQNQPPANQPYTIQANSRVVLTDVTVTDSKGNPVHGLPESVFQIFDNKKPQTIGSFEEHNDAPTPAAMEPVAAAKGVYSNDYLLHLPPVISVIIIDIANLGVPDQMYLYSELTRFFKDPPVQPLAIYLRAGNGCFLVQNFTTDRALLLAAVRKAIPRMEPTGREYLSDIDTMYQIAGYLSQLPGRKNVLWFSGGSTLNLRADADVYEDPQAWRDLYDLLEQERIAVYPIDARGLTTAIVPGMWAQDALMNETAMATGGQAFYNTNGMKEITNRILSTDGSFYTLTYSPHDFHFDNKWHKVRVALNVNGYQLSYRRGYFADGSPGGAQRPQEIKPRTRLLPNGEKAELPDQRSLPIIFQARVLPDSDPQVAAEPIQEVIQTSPRKKGTVSYSVRYDLPVSSLTKLNIDGEPKAVFGVAAIVLNGEGRAVDAHAERVTLTLNEDVVRKNPDAPLVFDQRLNFKKEDQYLYLAVWDMSSGRMGTLQVPLKVPKAGHGN
ncbi:MAG TPA: VWA domain-containing protein [Silvibacterium sp.]|jgi:VWFA-related protein|nr:VWA domain-containing protein [Silvibacterium sp.]